MVSAMNDDDEKATEGTGERATNGAAKATSALRRIASGSQSESSPHTRSANALADRIASQVALARRFNIRVMLRIGKAKASTKTTLVAVLRLENPKPQMAWNGAVCTSAACITLFRHGRRIGESRSSPGGYMCPEIAAETRRSLVGGNDCSGPPLPTN
jgi:hypothetical protein